MCFWRLYAADNQPGGISCVLCEIGLQQDYSSLEMVPEERALSSNKATKPATHLDRASTKVVFVLVNHFSSFYSTIYCTTAAAGQGFIAKMNPHYPLIPSNCNASIPSPRIRKTNNCLLSVSYTHLTLPTICSV